jgi:hypothetical protein
MLNKIETYPFTREGFELAQMSWVEKQLKNKNVIKVASTLLGLLMYSQNVLAAGNDAAFWKLVGVAQQGLFWLGILVSMYGLYLTLLKKDSTGKKIVVTCFIVYVASFLVPKGFILVRDIFGN